MQSATPDTDQGSELPRDLSLLDQLDEDEAIGLLVTRFRYFTGLGLTWSEALACAVGEPRAEPFVADRRLSA